MHNIIVTPPIGVRIPTPYYVLRGYFFTLLNVLLPFSHCQIHYPERKAGIKDSRLSGDNTFVNKSARLVSDLSK